jgi:hypothetical protein
MIEAVGREFLVEYWAIVERCMKPKDAVGVVQVITIPETRKYLNCLYSVTAIDMIAMQGMTGTYARSISFVNG